MRNKHDILQRTAYLLSCKHTVYIYELTYSYVTQNRRLEARFTQKLFPVIFKIIILKVGIILYYIYFLI